MPPSWIEIPQTQRILMATSETNKMQKRFLKSVKNWPFGAKNTIFPVLGAILNLDAILEFCDTISMA